MRNRLGTASVVAVLSVFLAHAEPGCPGTIQWDGGAGTTAWTTLTNWSTNTMPAPSDDVCIPELAPAVEVVHSTGTHAVHSLAGLGGLQVSGGTLSFAVSSPGLAQLLVSGGTLSGQGDLSVSGAFSWTGGTMSGAGRTTTTNGTLGGGTKNLTDGRVLRTSGTTTWTNTGLLKLGTGAVVENGGTWDAQGNATLVNLGAAGGFENPVGSTFKKTAGGGTTAIAVPFHNQGTLSVENGTVSLTGGSSTTGALQGATGTVLSFGAGEHVVAAGGSLGAATVQVDAASLTVAGSYAASATLVANGTLTFPPSASVEALGTVTIAANGTLDFGIGQTIAPTALNLVGGTLSATGDLRILSANPVLWSAGEMNGPGTTFVTSPYLTGVGVKVLHGARVLNSQGSVECQGPLRMGAGAAIENKGRWEMWGTIEDLGGAGGFRNDDLFLVDYGSAVVGVPFTNRGSVAIWYSGTLDFTAGYVQTRGSLDLGAHTVSSTFPLRIQGGTLLGPGVIRGDVVNGGTVKLAYWVEGSALSIDGDYTQTSNGAIEFLYGKRLEVWGGASLSGVLALGRVDGVQSGDTFTILTATSVSGTFSAYRMSPPLAAGLAWLVHVNPTTVVLEVVAGADVDGDQLADASDCAPADPGAWGTPLEVPGWSFTSDKDLLSWPNQQDVAGAATVYDVVRGSTSMLPVGGAGESCVLSGGGANQMVDSTQPSPGEAFYYLVRARNSCGTGGYGTGSGPRTTAACL